MLNKCANLKLDRTLVSNLSRVGCLGCSVGLSLSNILGLIRPVKTQSCV